MGGLVTAIGGLDDLAASPNLHAVSLPSSGTNGSVTSPAVKASFTSQLSGNHYVAPGDLYTIYDENAAITAGSNGSGVSIAVLTQANIRLADIAAFRTASGLSANAPTVKVYGTDPGYSSAADVSEAEMAVEWAGAAAPSASIVVVATSTAENSLIAAITNNVAPIIADSYGECEASLGAANVTYYNTLLAQAAAQGMTVVAPSGNTGAADCDYGATAASNGFGVDFPASSPYVTGVGGTQYLDGAGTYWNVSNGTNGGSALSYIPEAVLNENSLNPLFSSGGGASLFFPKPSWQMANGVPNDFARDVPDVALQASLAYDQHLICEQGYCVSGFAAVNGYLDVAGGTDLAAPEFAGFMALVVQKQGRIGVANNVLYALANSSYASAVFHDVTSGSSNGPCVTGSAGCSNGSIGFPATTGYDLATGLGSVDVFNLVDDWARVTPFATSPSGTTASTTNVSASATNVTAGTSITLTATVASGSSTVTTQPTGTVQFTVDGVTVGSANTLSAGVANYTLATSTLTAGAHTVQASYSGDATFAGSRGAFTIDVTAATQPDFTLTPATATMSAATGGISNGVVFTITPVNGFTGTVQMFASGPSNLAATPAFSKNPVQITGSSAQTSTLTMLAFTGLVQNNPTLQARGSDRQSWQRAGSGVLFAGALLLILPRRRRFTALLAGVVAVGALSLSGCYGTGTTKSSGSGRVNATPGTYVITVSATATINGVAVTHSSTVNFTVQ